MKEKGEKLTRVVCAICLAVLAFFFCATLVRTFTRQVLVKRMQISNAFTSLVLFDVPSMNDADERLYIDWAALYPFPNKEDEAIEKVAFSQGLYDGVSLLESNVKAYVTGFLVGHRFITEMAKQYENTIGWNYISYAEYNGVIRLADGYLAGCGQRKDVSGPANSVTELARFCEARDIDFVYVQPPCKISKFEDENLSGTLDFTNQNVDEFLDKLNTAGVNFCDFREIAHEEGLTRSELFYRTDHHWRAETGLWASGHLLRMLHNKLGYNIDSSVLALARFTSVEYPAWFLGSQGRKVTLSQTTPDDFTLLYPDYPTYLHYEVPSLMLDKEGNFSILYDMSQVEEIDYYEKNPYETYIYGDQPMERIENKLSENDTRILVIHDSFGNCVVPFLSLGVNSIDSLDLRNFNGSVQSYITETSPNVVMVLYTGNNVGPTSWDHTGMFDFR